MSTTTASIATIRRVRDYTALSDRAAARVGAALVAWADARTARRTLDRDRHALLVAADADRVAREHRVLAQHGPAQR